MKLNPSFPQAIVDDFTQTLAPWIRVLLLPPMVSPLAAQDFDEIFDQLRTHIKDSPGSQCRAQETAEMVFRWAHEAQELCESHRIEREIEDSTIEPSNNDGDKAE